MMKLKLKLKRRLRGPGSLFETFHILLNIYDVRSCAMLVSAQLNTGFLAVLTNIVYICSAVYFRLQKNLSLEA